jgi:hypothetical protein
MIMVASSLADRVVAFSLDPNASLWRGLPHGEAAFSLAISPFFLYYMLRVACGSGKQEENYHGKKQTSD